MLNESLTKSILIRCQLCDYREMNTTAAAQAERLNISISQVSVSLG